MPSSITARTRSAEWLQWTALPTIFITMRRECRCMQRVPRVREAISGTTKRDSRQLCPLRQIKIQPQLQWEECTIFASSVPENISTLRRGIRPIPISSSIPSMGRMIRSGRWRMPEKAISSWCHSPEQSQNCLMF